jgi:thiol-disulfide isomerase/thioredoxin
MKRTLIVLLPILIAVGCQNKNTFTISGVIKEPKGKTIFMKMVNINTPMLIDSSEIRKDGKFKFKINISEPEFYQLGFTDSDFITILAEPGEKISLKLNGNNFSSNYTVTGSEGSEKVKMLDMRLTLTKRKLDSLRTVYAAASGKPGFDEKGPLIENEFDSLLKDIRKKNIAFIIDNTKSMASIKALYQRIDENTYVLYDKRDLQYMKIVSDSLGRYYPNSRNVRALAEDVKRELNRMYTNQIRNMARTSPELKLDPNLKDISGNRIALSSLRGKVVLLTFWSVESKECITENLQLLNIYKAYKNKGFEIYQINIDEDEEKWKREVSFDELPWISTREDDSSSQKNAMLYNVRVLPANYLYDRDGTIVGSNLHGRYLQIRLNQLFND